ncbi:hypothetical protein KIW84_056082 [Lathyrus oleraceus]|uniref:Uncharacterized protein n=1 Tax=Pisum sativum TaxID=3888 RepID=A0A9D4WZJ4_PEA|nr:hypothetical protein KIW84_056082 [Pisum sativum]
MLPSEQEIHSTIFKGRPKAVYFNALADIIRGKLAAWKAGLLFVTGIVQLVRNKLFFKNYPHKDFVNPGKNRVEILCSESVRTRFFEVIQDYHTQFSNKRTKYFLIIMAGGSTVKEMTTNFGKLDKLQGQDFRRWQKKMHFMLTTLKVVHVLSTPIPELLEEDTVENLRRRSKWENDDYI